MRAQEKILEKIVKNRIIYIEIFLPLLATCNYLIVKYYLVKIIIIIS